MTYTVFGLQRTGTNFVEFLLRKNIKGAQIVKMYKGGNGIWKHAYDIENHWLGGVDKLHYLVEFNPIWLHKHPYSWIESCTARHTDLLKNERVIDPQKEMCRVRADTPDWKRMGKLNLDGLIQKWNDHGNYWKKKLDHPEYNVYQLSYEDLIESDAVTVEYVKKIVEHFNETLTSEPGVTVPAQVAQSARFSEERRRKYREVILHRLTWQQVNHINSMLDTKLMEYLGYSMYTSVEEYNNVYEGKGKPGRKAVGLGGF